MMTLSSMDAIPRTGYRKCTINAAKKSGNIETVSIADSESLEILGIYGRYTLVVYGE